MELTRGRRRALSTVLALVLAIESVSAVAAAAHVSTVRPDAATTTPQRAVPAAEVARPATARTPTADRAVDPIARRTSPSSSAPATEPATAPKPAKPAKPAADTKSPKAGTPKAIKPKASGRHERAESTKRPAKGQAGNGSGRHEPAYRGRNHLWVPSLGIDRSIAWFPCSRSREPDNLVYRWGCAGSNNVYLLGHAWGVFDPLHDAYVRGRLKPGMKAWYADANGRVSAYAVRWWKVVKPTSAAGWAWASLAKPSMTLQTCVGAKSQLRLMVRLARVG